jgi:hypothetical protein
MLVAQPSCQALEYESATLLMDLPEVSLYSIYTSVLCAHASIEAA